MGSSETKLSCTHPIPLTSSYFTSSLLVQLHKRCQVALSTAIQRPTNNMRSNRNSNFFIFFTTFSLFTSALELITVSETADFVNLTPSCNLESHKSDFSKKCITKSCARRVTDGLFHESDIKILHTIVEKGMSLRPALGGPTILDINTGYTTAWYLSRKNPKL